MWGHHRRRGDGACKGSRTSQWLLAIVRNMPCPLWFERTWFDLVCFLFDVLVWEENGSLIVVWMMMTSWPPGFSRSSNLSLICCTLEGLEDNHLVHQGKDWCIVYKQKLHISRDFLDPCIVQHTAFTAIHIHGEALAVLWCWHVGISTRWLAETCCLNQSVPWDPGSDQRVLFDGN